MFLIASRFIPPASTLIPTYLMFRALNLYDTLTGLILLNVAMNIPYVVWMMRGFIRDVPLSLEESAWLDGASRIRTFFFHCAAALQARNCRHGRSFILFLLERIHVCHEPHKHRGQKRFRWP